MKDGYSKNLSDKNFFFCGGKKEWKGERKRRGSIKDSLLGVFKEDQLWKREKKRRERRKKTVKIERGGTPI